MLDVECFTYLNRALESSISPIVILASNRGQCTIRGTEDIVSAHGIPPDLLGRLLIIPTVPYKPDEIRTIISLRSKTESLTMDDEALRSLAKRGENTSLRYALQLLTPASILAKVAGRQEIKAIDVEECEELFIDARRSAGIVANGANFMS